MHPYDRAMLHIVFVGIVIVVVCAHLGGWL